MLATFTAELKDTRFLLLAGGFVVVSASAVATSLEFAGLSFGSISGVSSLLHNTRAVVQANNKMKKFKSRLEHTAAMVVDNQNWTIHNRSCCAYK
ncbi:hypothetical protein T11_11803 [Trichinella zimbabwensis]|uniref:Uncharacterized protein n=1 Tax=Trichinella zimbabwensis TaxID=268475 RepID=A0A0V1HX28_9BILA|nr:hypothetical protein T11_11803 [Trichinella zimbabwensis]